MERSKANYTRPDGYTVIARAYGTPEDATPHGEQLNFLTNVTNTYNASTASWGGGEYNNNKHNVITISAMEKNTVYSKQYLMKNKRYLNSRTIKNHPPSPI